MHLRAALRDPRLWPWLIVIPGIILRLWHITSSPLWYDEAFTRLVVGLPLEKLLSATAADVHPPAYYLMVQTWTGIFGNTALGLRSFSALWSILSLRTFWLITEELNLPLPARLIALAFMAFHPSQIHYAQEARMYTLFQELILSQILSMIRGHFGWFGFYTLLSLYTHNYGLIYTPVIAAVGIIREWREYRKIPGALLASVILPGLLWLPWAYKLLGQMKFIAGGYWINPLSMGSGISALYQILAGFHVPSGLAMVSVFTLTGSIALLIIYGIHHKLWELLALAIAPVVLVMIISVIWKPILLFRGLIGILPPLFILAGILITRADLRGRWVAGALVLPLVGCLVWSFAANEVGMAKGTPLMNRPETTLPMVHLDDSTLVLLGKPGTDYLLDPGCPGEGGALTHQTRADLGFPMITRADLPQRFLFAGMITPLSTPCHEQVYREMIKTGRLVYQATNPLGEYGVWEYDR